MINSLFFYCTVNPIRKIHFFAMEWRDELPEPETLIIKILEEPKAQQTKNERCEQNSLYANSGKTKERNDKTHKRNKKVICMR